MNFQMPTSDSETRAVGPAHVVRGSRKNWRREATPIKEISLCKFNFLLTEIEKFPSNEQFILPAAVKCISNFLLVLIIVQG